MGQDEDLCIYEMGDCINDLNCSMCPVKEKFYKTIKAKKEKRKFAPSEWDELEIEK